MKRSATRTTASSASAAAPVAVGAASYDVVALVASAGGYAAIEKVLRGLPKDFAVPILVMQHLPDSMATPFAGYQRVPFKSGWARSGSILAPGSILVAPPRSFLEVLPDGSCSVSRAERGALDNPMDRLLQSLARNFAHRAIAVVLSGMMKDGAVGARDLRAAGGAVIVQSGAEYGSMPEATMQAGGADVRVPLDEIAGLLVRLTAGAPLQRPPSELEAVEALFAGEGRARAALRAVNWTATPLGGVLGWPPALTIAARNALGVTFPSCIFWGPDLVQIFNEAFLPILGGKPSPAGKPARLTWPELWPSLGPRLESVLRTGEAVSAEDQLVEAERHGYPEELYLTYSYSALQDDRGAVCGVLSTATETTEQVRSRRRLAVLAALAAVKHDDSALLVAERAARVLAEAPLDIPFALIFLLDKGRRRVSLSASVGLDSGTVTAPHVWALGDPHAAWPIADVVRTGVAVTVDDVASRLPGVRSGPWPEPPSSATLLPLRVGGEIPAGVIVVGLSPRLRSDSTYREFVRLVAENISAAMGDAEARRLERERVERLADLDQTKVEFFANVSHEFRTPLTLLLAPIELLLSRRAGLPPDLGEAVDAASRNGRRLLALIDTLLDFSYTESQKQEARFEPTDLSALTAEIAGAFRGAIEAAGLRLEVNCHDGIPSVLVDRQMWERIVANLLSNALKFTFEGKISVELIARNLHAELVIKDSGVGIPEQEVPNLFKRFHRIRETRARTAEGSGIGLWMVDHLARRLGAQLRVRSALGAGTTFTLWMPYKTLRNPGSRSDAEVRRPADLARQVASEAARWAIDARPDPTGEPHDVLGPPRLPASPTDGARVLVVDDNADMRQHLTRLLSPRWRVEVATNGEEALAKLRALRPDLLLADVMMPNLDGFGLVRAVRADEALRSTPVIVVTAHAGEEVGIEGMRAGADDYVAKPFSGRELIARVGSQLELARVRRRTAELNDFLVRFSDAVRALADPREVARAGLRMVVEQLGAQGAHWAEVDWTTREYVVNDAYRVDGSGEAPSPIGRVALDAGEPAAASWLEGRSVVASEARAGDRTPEETAAERLVRGRVAHISVPVLVDKRLRAVLEVGQSGPRRWTSEDIALVESVAGRFWAEIERARAEAAVRVSREALAAESAALMRLHEASARLWRSTDLRSGLAEILEATVSLLGADLGNVHLLNPVTRKLEIVAHRGFGDAFLQFFREVSIDDASACGRSLRSGQRTIIEDVTQDAEFAPFAAVAREAGYRAVQSTPLVGHDGEALGMLSTHFRHPHRPSEQDLRRLDLYARQAVDFIERYRGDATARRG